jgi:hypothetical protein
VMLAHRLGYRGAHAPGGGETMREYQARIRGNVNEDGEFESVGPVRKSRASAESDYRRHNARHPEYAESAYIVYSWRA